MIFFKTYAYNCHMAQQLIICPIDKKILYKHIHMVLSVIVGKKKPPHILPEMNNKEHSTQLQKGID